MYVCANVDYPPCEVKMPLKIFVADAGHRDRRQWCIDHRVGLLMSPEYATIPPPGATFMLDNGAFSAWKHHEEWDEKAYYRMLTRFHDAGLHPYGVVAPDIVKGGLEFLKRSKEHLPLIPPGMPRYLAVQEGITPRDVLPLLTSIDGIFVGSPGAWKWRTAREWAILAHKFGKRCHIGMVGTIRGYMGANAVGADSVDGSNLTRNRKLEKILQYRRLEDEQTRMDRRWENLAKGICGD